MDAPTQDVYGEHVSSPTSLAAVLWQGFNLLEGFCWRCNSSLEDPSLQSSLVLYQGSNLQEEQTDPKQPRCVVEACEKSSKPGQDTMQRSNPTADC